MAVTIKGEPVKLPKGAKITAVVGTVYYDLPGAGGGEQHFAYGDTLTFDPVPAPR